MILIVQVCDGLDDSNGTIVQVCDGVDDSNGTIVQVCDGVDDCGDRSDEPAGCTRKSFYKRSYKY